MPPPPLQHAAAPPSQQASPSQQAPRSTVVKHARPAGWSGTTGGYFRDGSPQVVAGPRAPDEVMADAEADELELIRGSSASGYKGVYKHNKYWRAQLRRRNGAGKHDNSSLTGLLVGETRSTPLEAALDYARMLRDADA